MRVNYGHRLRRIVMRAAVYAGPRRIEVTKRPDPVVAAPAQWSRSGQTCTAPPKATSSSPRSSTFPISGRRPRGLHPSRARLRLETNLDGIAEAYAAMDEGRAIKSLVP